MYNCMMHNKWNCIIKRFKKNIMYKSLDKFYKILILYLHKKKK